LFENSTPTWHRWSLTTHASGSRAAAGIALDAEPAFAAWDEALKSQGANPGTSADLTVATLMLDGLLHDGGPR